jgi:hypothetical protein
MVRKAEKATLLRRCWHPLLHRGQQRPGGTCGGLAFLATRIETLEPAGDPTGRRSAESTASSPYHSGSPDAAGRAQGSPPTIAARFAHQAGHELRGVV